MAVTTEIKTLINRLLKPVNLQVDSLTAHKAEMERIRSLERIGHLEGAVYPLLNCVEQTELEWIKDARSRYLHDLDLLMSGIHPESCGFDPENSFFNGSDAQMLYLVIREFSPKRIIEVGSGNSTRVARAALADGGSRVHHIAIDPYPREDIEGMVDEIYRIRLEELPFGKLEELADSLGEGDLLFIDSSHEVRVGGDLAAIFCRLLPRLTQGVVVHFHDIFLPFEYPGDFIAAYPTWGEQYLLQTWLTARPREVLWPGFYIQSSKPEILRSLGLDERSRAQSFWLRT